MKRYINLIKLLVSITILIVLFSFIDFNSFIIALKQSKKIFLIPIFILLLSFLIIRSHLFKRIINKDNKKISFKESFYLSLIAVALNIFLPASSGGLFRSYFGYKRTGLKEEMLSASIMDILIAAISIFALGLIFSWIFNIYYTIIFFILFTVSSIFLFFPSLIPWNLLKKLIKIFSKAELNREILLSSFTMRFKLKIEIFILSLISWFVSFFEFYLVCKMFSIDINPFYIFTISPLITLARIFPLTFTGLGSKDAVIIYFFRLINIDPALSLLASLTYFMINIIPGLFAIPLLFKNQQNKDISFINKKIKLAANSDKERWDDFVLKNNGAIFQLFKWKNVIEKTYNYKPYYFYLEENKKILAILPTFLVKSKFFGSKLISIPHGDEAGPLGDNEVINQILDEIDKKLLKIDQIEIHNFNIDHKGFTKPWNYYTFLIDISRPEQELLNSLDKKLRNTIKRAQKEDLVIEEIKSLKELKTFYSIYQKNMHELGTPPLTFNLFKNIFLELYPSNLKSYLVRYNKDYIAGTIFLVDNKTARWLFGVTHPKFRNKNPMTLMIWQFIVENHKKLKTLDLSVSRPNSGNFDFKKKWNGKILEREWKYKFFNKKIIADPRTEELTTYIKIWKKVPLFICNIIGPKIRKMMGR